MSTVETVEPNSDDVNSWALGWVFFKTDGQDTHADRHPGPDLTEWVKGFAAAMADYDLDHDYSSLQDALQQFGVDEELVMACLDAAERIIGEPEFNRWPNVPVRLMTNDASR